jgi:hypothetical protein
MRHVGRTDDGDRTPGATDRYYEVAPIADFALTLAVDGRNIAMSDSDVDNLEQLSYKLTRSGNYTLEVFRYDEGGIKNETFALATRVLNNPPMLSHLGTSRSLADGAGGVSRSFDEAAALDATAVPEPTTGFVLFTLGAAVCSRRGARRRLTPARLGR